VTRSGSGCRTWSRTTPRPVMTTPGTSELRREGDIVPVDENRAHDKIGERLRIFDMARGAEVAGSGFYYWRGDGARLAWAIFS
jgi:seryl-tRNA synthetase